MENYFFCLTPDCSLIGAMVYTNKMVQGLLTPAFRPGIKGRESHRGLSNKKKKGFDFMKKHRFERTAGLSPRVLE